MSVTCSASVRTANFLNILHSSPGTLSNLFTFATSSMPSTLLVCHSRPQSNIYIAPLSEGAPWRCRLGCERDKLRTFHIIILVLTIWHHRDYQTSLLIFFFQKLSTDVVLALGKAFEVAFKIIQQEVAKQNGRSLSSSSSTSPSSPSTAVAAATTTASAAALRPQTATEKKSTFVWVLSCFVFLLMNVLSKKTHFNVTCNIAESECFVEASSSSS